jgi:hypothetical protein
VPPHSKGDDVRGDAPDDVLRITAEEIDRAEPLAVRPAGIPPGLPGGLPGVYCPMCGSAAAASARLCPSCGEVLVRTNETEPADKPDLRQRMHDAEIVPFVRRVAVASFIGAVIGVLAPVALIAGLILLIAYRRPLRMAGAVYVALACFAVLVSLVYSGMAIAALTFW